jgi:hypothetical protein
MCGYKVKPRIDVTSKEDGAIITVEGIEIEITIKPTWKYIRHLESSEESMTTIESLRRDLVSYLKDLDIYEGEDKIVVKPKRYLGRDFPPVAEIIEYYGGSYVSEGRSSRFIISKDKPSEEKEIDEEEETESQDSENELAY